MNKKKFLSVLLVLVLACSMVFMLTACNNEVPAVEPDYATFYYQSDISVAPTTEKVYLNDFSNNATLNDVLSSKNTKYNFDADIAETSWGPLLNAIKGKGVTPSKAQYISIYTSVVPQEITEYTQVVEIENTKFYSSPVGISEVKLTKDTKYLFRVEDNSYVVNVKLDKNLAVDSTQPWLSPITAPVIVGDNLFVIRANELLMLDKNGNIVKTQTLNGSTYYGMSNPIFANNKIICPVSEHIQAFNTDMTPAWDYENIGGGDIKSNLVYDEKSNNIYAGFFNDYGNTAKFVCLNATNGTEVWNRDIFNGYDFGGAVVVEDYVVIKNATAQKENSILSLNKMTGNEVCKLVVKGIVDSQIVFENSENALYFTVSERDSVNPGKRLASYIEKVNFDAKNGKFGIVEEMQTKYCRSVGVPAVNNGRLYITSNNANFSNPAGCMQVVDTSTMTEIYSVETGAANEGKQFVKNVKNSYRDEVFVFFTLNNAEGGLYYIVDTEGATGAVVKTLYVSENKNYSMSDVVVDSDGTMYCKNDSASIFGVNIKL